MKLLKLVEVWVGLLRLVSPVWVVEVVQIESPQKTVAVVVGTSSIGIGTREFRSSTVDSSKAAVGSRTSGLVVVGEQTSPRRMEISPQVHRVISRSVQVQSDRGSVAVKVVLDAGVLALVQEFPGNDGDAGEREAGCG